MRKVYIFAVLSLSLLGCTTTKNITYLQNLDATSGSEFFTNDRPDYKVQYRDILYFDIKTLTTDGKIENVLQRTGSSDQMYLQGEASQYLAGYSVDKDGKVLLPVIGSLYVGGKTLKDIRQITQVAVDSVYRHAFVEIKLLSFKFTVLGEARTPGTYLNYSDFLTVFEAIGRAGGINDYGRRDRILIVRTTQDGSQVFRINVNDKNILTSEGYFILPNDVIIVDPTRLKSLNMNLPTISFVISSVTGILTTTLLLINYFK
jgi:polysaccharide biosynthesis/export protein